MFVQTLEGADHWSETTAGTDSGAAATKAAESGSQHFVTGISGHTDADSLITIKDGSTVIWEIKIDVSVAGLDFHCAGLVLPITPGAAASGNIAASSADCQVAIWGITI